MAQRAFAYLALFFLPLSALNFGVSFLWGDVFLILAVLLNAGELVRIRPFQIPFLLASPFFLLSTALDPEANLVSLAQTLYLWVFVVPFGWIAFAQIPRRTMAKVLVCSFALSSLVAIGQTLGYLPKIGTQYLVEYFNGRVTRAAGLSVQCNELAAGLTSAVALVCYLASPWGRLVGMMTLLVGMVATMSKAVVFSVPALVYVWWREPRKRVLLVLGLVAGGLVAVWVKYKAGDAPVFTWMAEAFATRLEKGRASISLRLEIVRYALAALKDCLWLGYGIEGTRMLFLRESTTGNTVHVYYLGLIVIAGLPAALLWLTGVGSLMAGLIKERDWTLAVYLGSHLLALLALTVLNISASSLPLMVAGAVVARDSTAAESTSSSCIPAGTRVRRAAA